MTTTQNISAFYPQQLQSLRAILFWDADIRKIDWQKNKVAVIQRVYQRGNEAEKKAIISFYGAEEVKAALLNS